MNAFDTSYMKPSSYVTETRKHICYVFLGNFFFSISTLFRRFYFAKVCLHAPSSLIVSTALQMSCLLRQITSFILSASCVSMLITVWILYSSVLNGYRLVSYGH